jgi:hypothetical protein
VTYDAQQGTVHALDAAIDSMREALPMQNRLSQNNLYRDSEFASAITRLELSIQREMTKKETERDFSRVARFFEGWTASHIGEGFFGRSDAHLDVLLRLMCTTLPVQSYPAPDHLAAFVDAFLTRREKQILIGDYETHLRYLPSSIAVAQAASNLFRNMGNATMANQYATKANSLIDQLPTFAESI